MIARLLISQCLDVRKEEIDLLLKSHLGGGPGRQPRENLVTHPDLLYFKADDKLGIEQARQIKTHFSIKPYSAKGRVVVLEDASNLTVEAQNALLKTLEEPPKGALLILAARNDASLLPTLLSRCQIIKLNSPAQPEKLDTKSDVEKLLSQSPQERFEYIEKLKDKDQFLKELIADFRQYLHSQKEKGALKDMLFLKELLQAEQWAKQNVNTRAILEYLMLVMPSKV